MKEEKKRHSTTVDKPPNSKVKNITQVLAGSSSSATH
jgi:hypothetical protein